MPDSELDQPNSSQANLGVRVELGARSYSIEIGRGLLSNRFSQLLGDRFPDGKHAVLVFDAAVQEVASTVQSSLTHEWRVSSIAVPSGESSKSVSQAECLWQRMLEERTDRGSVVIAVGGGVVGDLAGFMAATFARGIPLVQVPTTLLSQVDSSVGGKTGLNLPGAKNIIGAFWQPSLVVIDTQTLDSLPEKEFVSGLAEVVKYGVIMAPELFAYLENHSAAALAKEPSTIAHLVATSCRCKASVVQDDEQERSGRRAILNYGHTFGHALESVSGYGTLLHGEAVAIGMHMAGLLAEQLGRVDQAFVDRQASLLERLHLPTRFAAADPERMWAVMQHDKKVEHGRLRFILPSRMGHVELVSGVGQDEVLEAIKKAQ